MIFHKNFEFLKSINKENYYFKKEFFIFLLLIINSYGWAAGDAGYSFRNDFPSSQHWPEY